MNSMITYFLSVRYQAPSKERAFLDKNWGIRDVNGPYLTSEKGFIILGENILSLDIPSTISLTISVSNIYPIKFATVRVIMHKNIIEQKIEKNTSSEFIFESIRKKSSDNAEICVLLMDKPANANSNEFMEMISIIELNIERCR